MSQESPGTNVRMTDDNRKPRRSNRFDQYRGKARSAVGPVLIVVLLVQFFSIRADIGNFSGIENVQVYMKGVFNVVVAMGIAFGVLIATRESR